MTNWRKALPAGVLVFALGFLALVQSVNGQGTIIYMQPSQPINYGTFPVSFNLDLNNDGITDFVMSCDIGGVDLTPQGNNRVAVDGSFLVAALNQGEQISPSLNPVYQWTGGSVTLGAQAVFDGQYFYVGNFSEALQVVVWVNCGVFGDRKRDRAR
jgi:hypothetical protein